MFLSHSAKLNCFISKLDVFVGSVANATKHRKLCLFSATSVDWSVVYLLTELIRCAELSASAGTTQTAHWPFPNIGFSSDQVRHVHISASSYFSEKHTELYTTLLHSAERVSYSQASCCHI